MAFVKDFSIWNIYAFDILSSQCKGPLTFVIMSSPDSSWTLKPSVCYIQDTHKSIVWTLWRTNRYLLTFQSNVIGIWFSCLDSLMHKWGHLRNFHSLTNCTMSWPPVWPVVLWADLQTARPLEVETLWF